ncbi:hypothetical protein PLICRDRAFT_178156 [Plicaturopsis crispa FD-325 SS-3]|nr:hypothetical protein PLICRDRAFT_178156 [Plicaturopsis crispa FD-325 SS-3]
MSAATPESNTSLESNVWFITGSSSGFGRNLVERALARGERVLASARDPSKLADLPASPNLHVLQLDVLEGPAAIKARVDEAVKVWGRIDVLVNNAGLGLKSLIEEGGSDMARKQFDISFFSVLDVNSAVLPYMRARRSGTVVLVGSRSSWRGELPATGIYASSKAAVRVIGETMAAELAQFSIRVTVLEPASFATNTLAATELYVDNPILDYDAMREECKGLYAQFVGFAKGSPAKAMDLLVDVVKGEGKAKGKPFPMTLAMGHEADRDIRLKVKKTMEELEIWSDVIKDLDFD